MHWQLGLLVSTLPLFVHCLHLMKSYALVAPLWVPQTARSAVVPSRILLPTSSAVVSPERTVRSQVVDHTKQVTKIYRESQAESCPFVAARQQHSRRRRRRRRRCRTWTRRTSLGRLVEPEKRACIALALWVSSRIAKGQQKTCDVVCVGRVWVEKCWQWFCLQINKTCTFIHLHVLFYVE